MTEYTEKELQELIKTCYSKADLCRALGLKPVGENYRIVDKIILKFNLDTSHLNQGPWNKGKYVQGKPVLKLEDILVVNSPINNTNHLKNRLYRNKLKFPKCELCGYTENLELHHINGNPTDNRLENLQILCPNCHAKTPNFRYRNGTSRKHLPANALYLTEEQAVDRYQNKLFQRRVPDSERKYFPIENKICPICQKEFLPRDKYQKFCSQECYSIEKANHRPPFIELIKVFKKYKSFVQVGKYYNVTDNAVRKWCQIYHIPVKSKELKQFIQDLSNL